MNQNESEFREERPAGTGDLPREIEPPRDLWTGIAERIRAEGRVDAPLPARRRPIPGRFDAWRRPLLAASRCVGARAPVAVAPPRRPR